LEAGTILLYLAIIFGSASVASSILRIYTEDEFYQRLAKYMLLGCFLVITTAFVLLVYYFVVSDLHIEYVHSYTHVDHEFQYKLTGVWAGEKGTILLWAWLISLSLAVQEMLQYRKEKRAGDAAKSGDLYVWIRAIAMVILVAFLFLSISVDVFKETAPWALAQAPEGWGLNPLLLTPLMILHPPLEFLGYAFLALPLASALAYLITEDKKWVEVSLQWTRLGWLFLTAAIGVGALWAYTVLGWGGYWGWDPVEVANLIPWIALTAFAHTQAYNRKRNQYKFLAPLLAVISFVLILFSTFETRSGFVESPLHAFTGTEDGSLNPGDRLIDILNGNFGAGFHMMMMLAILIAAGILFLWLFTNIRRREGSLKGLSGWFPNLYMIFLTILLLYAIISVSSFVSLGLRLSSIVGVGNQGIGLIILALMIIGLPLIWIAYTSPEREEDDAPITLATIINDKTTMIVSAAIFTIWFVTTFLLMILGSEGLQPEVFESRLPLILIPLMITLAVCLAWRYLGRQNSVYLIVALTLATLLAYFAVFSGNVFGAYVVALIGALSAALYKIFMIASGSQRKSAKKGLLVAGLFLIIAGILGMIFWSNLTRIYGFSPPMKPDLLLGVLGFVASAGAMVGGLFCLRGRSLGMSIVGAVLGIFSLGFFFAGSVLSIISLILILISLSSFSRDSTYMKSIRGALGGASPHIIHLGIVLLLIGYAGSTYLVAEKKFEPMSEPLLTGTSADFEGYDLELVDSRGTDSDGDGYLEDIEAVVEITRDGSYVGEATFHLWWMISANPAESHYMLDVYVENTYYEDIYFIPRAFAANNSDYLTGELGETLWIQAHEPGRMFTDGQVVAVAFEIKTLPLINALWGGLWILSLGIFLLIFVDYLPLPKKPAKKEKAKVEEEIGDEETQIEEDVDITETDYEKKLEEELGIAETDYEKRLEEELMRMEE
jgi:cytochrome c-type biogenesis protein CcmF